MNQGKYVFSQIIEFIPRYQFDKLVRQYKGDWHVKSLHSYNHLLHLLFGQLTGCDSLRDICLCLEVHSKILYHLGFRKTVNHTSLSRANEKRDYRIFEGLGICLMEIVRPMYSKMKLSENNHRQCNLCIRLHDYIHQHKTCRLGFRQIQQRGCQDAHTA